MAIEKLQASRFELKYIISEQCALQVREFVRCRLELDEHGIGCPDYSYPVHSLYLDSPDLKLHWMTINGTKNRFKLRVRFYNDDPDGPAFFEIKRRMNNCIMKQRAAVQRSAVDTILAGQMPPPGSLLSKSGKDEVALLHFLDLTQHLEATPTAHVACYREAYLPHDGNAARLTLDRCVLIEPEFTDSLTTAMLNPTLVWENKVILELKFTNQYPNWFAELVRTFNLRQSGAAKYADGIVKIGEAAFTSARARHDTRPLSVRSRRMRLGGGARLGASLQERATVQSRSAGGLGSELGVVTLFHQ